MSKGMVLYEISLSLVHARTHARNVSFENLILRDY